MGRSDRIAREAVAVILAGSSALADPARAEDLKPTTIETFDHYVQRKAYLKVAVAVLF